MSFGIRHKFFHPSPRIAAACVVPLFAGLMALAIVGPARSAVTPYDPTGHWVGNVSLGGNTLNVSSDLQGQANSKFSGTISIGGVASGTVAGQLKANDRVKMTFTIQGAKLRANHATLNRAANSVTGTYKGKLGGQKVFGAFTITKQ